MITEMILYAGFSGFTILLGGILANLFNHHKGDNQLKIEISHTLTAFGGGIILSALSLVLIPKGMEELTVGPLSISFGAGAILFFILDRFLEKRGGKMATLLAMLLDYIPESIALGAIFVLDPSTALLLAIYIGLQNLPEAFISFRDLVLGGYGVRKTLLIFFFLSFSGIAAVLIGHYLLVDAPKFTAHLMIFSSGGILYLLFQDIAPASKMKNSWFPALGATLGFLIGIIGDKLV